MMMDDDGCWPRGLGHQLQPKVTTRATTVAGSVSREISVASFLQMVGGIGARHRSFSMMMGSRRVAELAARAMQSRAP